MIINFESLKKLNKIITILIELLLFFLIVYGIETKKEEKKKLKFKAIINFMSKRKKHFPNIPNSINIQNSINISSSINISNSINISDLKVCVCTLGRNENRYIREFVNHYKKYGVDKIFLYDNNLVDGEKFEDVINDYIQKGFVEILNWRGRNAPVFSIMNECYKNNKDKYDWIIFYEIDEFLNLYNYTNIKQFLSQSYFANCQIIHLNIINHSDNDKLYYENKSLIERFPAIVPLKQSQISVKSIVRGHLDHLLITWMHWINPSFRGCNGFGGPTDLEHGNDFLYYVIDHYYSKSTEEFINKINRGDAWRNTQDYINHRTEKYLNQNHVTLEKIEMLERGIKINLSRYKERFKKNISRKRHRI